VKAVLKIPLTVWRKEENFAWGGNEKRKKY